MKTRATKHVLDRPWAITEDALRIVLAIASREEHFAEALRARAEEEHEHRGGSHRMSIEDGVAVIKVIGPLVRHAGLMSDISGATSYGALRRQLQAALDDSQVSAILLKIDSSGGEANGCGDLAAQIRQFCEKKPIVAYAEGYAASAAYWLGSAASKIYCAPTSFLGSIGVRMAILDDSDALADQGLREIEIVSSQSPDKRSAPIDDALLSRIQTRIDDLAAIFVADVSRYRGAKEKTVVEDFGRGDVLIASKAVAAGLGDEIGDYAAAIGAARAAAARKRSGPPPAARRISMSTKTLAERLDALAAQTAEQGNSMSAELSDIAAGVTKLQADNAKLKADQVNMLVELDQLRFEGAIRTGWNERRITSPAQEAAIRTAYAGDLAGLKKYLSLQMPAPALQPPQRPAEATSQAEEEQRKQSGGGQLRQSIESAMDRVPGVN